MKIFQCFALPAMMFFAAPDSEAQTVITYTATVHEHNVGTSPKAMFTALIDIMPNADVSHDASTQLLRIVTTIPIGYEELTILTDENGYELISVEEE